LHVSGSRGRPAVKIDVDQLRFLRRKGFTGVKIAKQCGCSPSLVYKKLASNSLHMRTKYSNVDDTILDAAVTSVHEKNRSAGNEVGLSISQFPQG